MTPPNSLRPPDSGTARHIRQAGGDSPDLPPHTRDLPKQKR